MAEMHTYNSTDIKRYLQQQMPKEEMHAFEKAMMNDPFLADALEGYQTADWNEAEQHLTEIEQQVTGAKEKAKVVPFAARSYNWLRIAALFIVIAGAALFTYKFLDKPDENSIAATKINKPVIPVDTIKSVEPNKALASPELFPSKDALADNKKTGSPVIKETIQTRNSTPNAVKDIDEKSSAMAFRDNKDLADNASKTPPVSSAPMAARNMKSTDQEQEIKGRVMNTKGEPVANASVTINNNAGTTADANGSFTIKTPDSAATVSVASVGYAPVNATLKKNEADNKIVMKESSEALAEVVTIGQRKLAGKAAGISIRGTSTNTQAEPEGGWQNFNRYIDSSLMKAKQNNDVSVSGDVELEFLVDKDGRPADIKTITPSQKQLEEKAIQLLQQGPKWKTKGKNTKAKVVIQF